MIAEYCNYLRAIRGYSENTVKAYRNDLFCFVAWARERSERKRWSEFTREDIDSFITHQHDKGLKPSTTNRQLAAISSLYRFMQRNGLDVKNPCQYESRRKLPQKTPTTIPVSDIKKAYQNARGSQKLMIGILATTGIRIQELLDLTWKDINFTNCTLHVNGKGSKERIVSTTAEVLAPLAAEVAWANPNFRIFYQSQRQARYLIEEALRPYTNSPYRNPHSIRHTYATELAKHGENNATIAKILGHSRLETSQRYIDFAQIPTSHKGICLT